MSEKIQSIATKIGFAVASITALVMLFLFKKNQRSLADLRLEADRRVLQQKLGAIQEKANKSEEDYSKAHGDYLRLKRNLPGVFKRTGFES